MIGMVPGSCLILAAGTKVSVVSLSEESLRGGTAAMIWFISGGSECLLLLVFGPVDFLATFLGVFGLAPPVDFLATCFGRSDEDEDVSVD